MGTCNSCMEAFGRTMCTTLSTTLTDASLDHVAPRTRKQLLSKEKPRVNRLLKNLKHMLPTLLAEFAERSEGHELKVGDLDGALQSNLNTLRDICVQYSMKATDNHRWTRRLKKGEAMRLLEIFFELESTKKALASPAVKEIGLPLEQHFALINEAYEKAPETEADKCEPGEGLLALTGFVWDDLVSKAVLFSITDVDCGGTLTHEEIAGVIFKLSIGISRETVAKRIQQADKNDDRNLHFDEFLSFYKALTFNRFIQQVLFGEHAKENRDYMTGDEFGKFLVEVQHDPRGEPGEARDAFFKDLVGKMRLGRFIDGKFTMNSEQFCQWLTKLPRQEDEDLDLHNSCFDPAKTCQVYQNMKKPMTDYFIASSHNTYLSSHQLWGESSELAYLNALASGCRCVELDCWDGSGGEPIVYHGHTATTQVSFEKCIKTIAEHSFKASPYPVILSLELHASKPQQKRMGEIMKTYFTRQGEKGKAISLMCGLHPPIAYTNHQKSSLSFTPEGLRGFILVKGQMLSNDQPGFDEHLTLVKELNVKMGTGHEIDASRGADAKEAEDAGLEIDAETAAKMQKEMVKVQRDKKEEKKSKIDPELSSCVWMKAVHFRGLNETLVDPGVQHWDVSSFKETVIHKYHQSDVERKQYCKVNQKVFSRVYPSAAYFNSQNYHPQKAWNMGCQIVALNYQLSFNRSAQLRYNLGKFKDNGKSGYLLKPPPLRDGADGTGYTDSCTLTVEIIQAFDLPKVKIDGQATGKGEKIDPYVMAFVAGVDEDMEAGRGAKGGNISKMLDSPKDYAYRTLHVEDNGFNPEFFECNDAPTSPGAGQSPRDFGRNKIRSYTVNQSPGNLFQWKLQSKEMAVLTLRVMDSDGDMIKNDDFVAECVVPLNTLRSGYRVVPLNYEDAVDVPQGKLLCHFTISDAAE